jgi:hypothetical protein
MKNYFSERYSGRTGTKTPSLHSYGKSGVRAGSMLACLCANRKTYSKACCKGYLVNQTIGNTVVPYPIGRAFSNGFSNGFS